MSTSNSPPNRQLAGSSNAHHSDAIYDRETTVAGEGIVTLFTYRNPHVLIGVELENDDGEIVEWLVEMIYSPQHELVDYNCIPGTLD